MDFTPNNPNLTNPGASFTEAFGRGQQLGFQKQQLAQQKELTMAQMGQQQRQFDVVEQLQQQQMDLNRQKTMADLSMMGTQQKLMGIQIDQQQFQADQLPKQAANQAYIQQAMAAPDTFDPTTGASTFASKLANVPHPEALNPVESNQLQIQVADRNSKTQLGQSLAAQNVAQTNDINSFVQMGGDVKPFLIDPKGPPIPQNVNMAALGQANKQAQIQFFQTQNDITTQSKLKLIGATGDQRVNYANAQAQGRAATTDERSLVLRANATNQHVRDLIKAGATPAEINDAKTESEYWNGQLQSFRVNPQRIGAVDGTAAPTQTPAVQSSTSWIQGLQGGQ